MPNGQNVLVYAPRRYGKSSLVLRAAREAIRRKALVGYCDLMKTPTKERFAAALARTIYADVASPIGHEHNHLAQLWDEAPHPQLLLLLALADEPTGSVHAADHHARHELPANPTLQTALAGLVRKELVGRGDGDANRVIEPFLAEWLQREQRA